MDAYKIFGHVADWFATHPGMVVAGVAIYNVIKTVKRLKNYTGTAAQKIGIGVCEVPQKIISVAFWAGAIEFALKTISDNALKYAYISDSIKNIVESARKAFHEMYPTVAKMAMWTVDHWGATIAIASVSAIMLYIKHKIKENMHQQAEEMRKRYNENYLHQRDLEALELENELLEQRRREEEGNGFTTVN
jgi:hypothetical protein